MDSYFKTTFFGQDLQDLTGFYLIIFGFLKKPKIFNPPTAEVKILLYLIGDNYIPPFLVIYF